MPLGRVRGTSPLAEPRHDLAITPGPGGALGAPLPTRLGPKGLETGSEGLVGAGGPASSWVPILIILRAQSLLMLHSCTHHVQAVTSERPPRPRHRDAACTGMLPAPVTGSLAALPALPRCSFPPHQICITPS